MATVLAVWAGPYLAEVHGLAPEPRGAVLLLMGLARAGRVARHRPGGAPLRPRAPAGRRARGGRGAGARRAGGLAAARRLPAAAGLLVLLCLLSCFPVVVVTQGRALFPDHLVGRGATTVNLAQTVGCAALPALTGAVVALAPAGDAWPVAFATLAAAMALGLAGYLAGGTLLPERPGGDGKR